MENLELPQLKGRGVLTHSRMQCYKTCPRKHYYRYELGIRKKLSPRPLRMGGAVHYGLERMGTVDSFDVISREIREYYQKLLVNITREDEAEKLRYESVEVEELLLGYWNQYSLNKTWVELHAEMIVETPIRNPESNKETPSFSFAGKIDKLVLLNDGRMAIVETKTCSEDLSVESDYWKRLRIDQQISAYYLAARNAGHDIQTVIYDCLRKPGTEPSQCIPVLDENGKKIVVDQNGERVFKEDGTPRQSADKYMGWVVLYRKETQEEYGIRLRKDIAGRPDRYFARREIPRLQSDLEEYAVEQWDIQKQIRQAQIHNRWYRNTSACRTYGTPCEYFDVCVLGIDIQNEMPQDFEKVNDIHPELAAAIGDEP